MFDRCYKSALFIAGLYQVSVAEDTVVGAIVNANITAEDIDQGSNAEFTFTTDDTVSIRMVFFA